MKEKLMEEKQDLALSKKRKTSLFKRRTLVLALSFLLPGLILFVAYMINQFYPVGKRTPLTIDLYHQYVAFMAEMRRKLLNGESIFYSWSIGLGTNFYGLTAYYTASPLNILLLLFPLERITDAVLVLTILKIALTGLTFSYFLLEGPVKRLGRYTVRARDELRSNTAEDIATDVFVVIASTAFALNGFNLAYSWDIMWLDVIALLPLVALGVNRVVRESRHGLYIVSLALSLAVNYYMAFFVCIFTALYFFVVYLTAHGEKLELKLSMAYSRRGIIPEDSIFNPYESDLRRSNLDGVEGEVQSNKAESKQRVAAGKDLLDLKLLEMKFWPIAFKFAAVTLISVAISAIMLLPTFLSLADTSAAGDLFPKEMRTNFDSFDFLGRNLMNMPANIRRGLPNIYMGILAFVFLPLYIASSKISTSEKLGHLGLLGFLFISFNNNFLDFIWHGMHYPNQLPYRYAFLFAFVMCIVVFRTLTIIREYSPRTLMASTGIAIILVSLIEKLNDDLNRESALFNILFLLIYLAVFAVYRKPRYFRTASLLLAVVIIGEISINTIVTVYNIGDNEVYTSRPNFIAGMEDVEHLISTAKELENNDFFRMEILPQKTTNDGALYGYPGFTLFSSTSREDTASLFRNLGYHGNNINSYKYTASTPLANSLFGLKYQLLKNGASRDTGLKVIEKYNDMTLLQNPYALEVGVPAGPDLLTWNPQKGSPFENFNNLLKRLGEDGLYEHITPTVVDGYNYFPASGGAESGLTFNPENYGNASLMNLKINVEKDQYVFLAVDTHKDTKVNIRINESLVQGIDENGEVVEQGKKNTVRLAENRTIHWIETFDLGYAAAGDVIDISLENEKDKASALTVYAATMDKAKYEATMTRLQDRMIDVNEWGANYLKANYTAREDGYLYLSIPYDSSWQAYVDGEEVNISSIAQSALLTVPTTKGEHNLELRFVPRGFKFGMLLTFSGILLLIALLVLEKNILEEKAKKKVKTYVDYRDVYFNNFLEVERSAEELTGEDIDLKLPKELNLESEKAVSKDFEENLEESSAEADTEGKIEKEYSVQEESQSIDEAEGLSAMEKITMHLNVLEFNKKSFGMSINEINTYYPELRAGHVRRKTIEKEFKVLQEELKNFGKVETMEKTKVVEKLKQEKKIENLDGRELAGAAEILEDKEVAETAEIVQNTETLDNLNTSEPVEAAEED